MHQITKAVIIDGRARLSILLLVLYVSTGFMSSPQRILPTAQREGVSICAAPASNSYQQVRPTYSLAVFISREFDANKNHLTPEAEQRETVIRQLPLLSLSRWIEFSSRLTSIRASRCCILQV